jgi:hypothetical protein
MKVTKIRKGYVATSANGMNHKTTEIAVATSRVIAWGRASRETLNLIFKSPILDIPFWGILWAVRQNHQVALINAYPSLQVPSQVLV